MIQWREICHVFYRRTLGAGLIFVLGFKAISAPAIAQDTLTQELKRALEENAKSLSPITVTWERKRSSQEKTSRALSIIGLPDTAHEFFGPEKVRFMWNQGNFYLYFWRSQPTVNANKEFELGAMEVVEQEQACDGSKFYSGNPNRRGDKKIEDSIILIDRLAMIPKQQILTADYVYLAGFRLPQTASDIKLKPPITLLLEELALGGTIRQVSMIEIDGRQFTQIEVLKDGEKHLFVMDPQRNYALRRRTTYYSSGELSATVDCQDFHQLPGTSLWFPKRISVGMYFPAYSSTEPLVLEESVVSELHNHPIPDSQFVLAYTDPGTHVADGSLPGAETKESGRISYVVPADPKDLDKAIELATHGIQKRSGVPIFLITNLIVLGCLIIVVWIFRSRQP